MDRNRRERLAIVFGGRSKEHQVSCSSAASVIRALDKEKYEIKCLGITQEGKWRELLNESLAKQIDDMETGQWVKHSKPFNVGNLKEVTDFVLPIIHGPYCEDGKLQGLFETLDVPYGGCGVLASALAMDKVIAKDIFIKLGLPTCQYVYVSKHLVETEMEKAIFNIEEKLDYPIFVKPANLGSSVGISKVKNRTELTKALREAIVFDRRIIAEECIDGRELEVGIIGSQNPEASPVGEILTDAEFYDYDAKYVNVEGLKLSIPADISEEKSQEIREMALKAYKAIDCEGFARVDFFMDRKNDKVYINEINTIPGFTKYSMFPLLWESGGVSYSETIERIIRLGYERYNAKNNG